MQVIKIIVRKYEKKAGGTFTKLSVGGKFVPSVLADESKQYQVKFTSKSAVKEPTEEASISTSLSNVSSPLKWFLSTMSFR